MKNTRSIPAVALLVCATACMGFALSAGPPTLHQDHAPAVVLYGDAPGVVHAIPAIAEIGAPAITDVSVHVALAEQPGTVTHEREARMPFAPWRALDVESPPDIAAVNTNRYRIAALSRSRLSQHSDHAPKPAIMRRT